MKKLFTLLSFLGISLFASAQLQLDKQMQMTGGTDSDRRITNLGDPAGASDAVNVKTIQAGTLLFDETTGSGGNYVVNLNPNPASYTMGMIVNFKANHNNGGSATLKVGSLAAIDIRKGVVNTLSANDIVDDQLVSVMFDGTNFQILSGTPAATSLPPSGPAGGDLTGTYPNPDIAANAVTASEIAADAVGSSEIATDAVTTTEILDGTIASADIADGTIATADLATVAAAGTYTSVTVNAQGQVTAGTNPGFTTGSGSSGHVTYWTGASTQSYDTDGNFFWDATNNRLGIGNAAPAQRLNVGGNGQSTAMIATRGSSSNAFEWGHGNTAGYGSTLGNQDGGGQPFLAFSAEAGTTSNTYRTRGLAGTVIIGDLAGGLSINSVPGTNADNQALTPLMTVQGSGNVGIGTITPGAKLDVVSTTTLGRIRVSGVQTGYTQADVLLQTGTTHSPEGRGTGIYTQNQGNNTTWYFGNPYSSPDMFVINRKAGTGLLVETAQNNASGVLNVLSITGGGNVGIGTAGSANKLNVVNSTLSGGTAGMIAINSTYSLDQPPADIRAAIAGIGHYTTTANVRSAGIYGWVPTGGHGTLAAAAIFDRPDNNRRIFIGGSQTAISTPSIHVYNTSTTGTDFIVDNSGRVGIGTVSPSTPLHVNGTATATALAGAFDQSASGYVRIGNMQIAWGTTVLASGQGWTTGSGSTRYVLCGQNITFPAAFSSAPTVTFGMIDGQVAARSAYVSYFLPTTTNVNTIYLTSPITHFETSAVTVHWTAIGRWQ